MSNLLNIEIIENDKGGHEDLIFDIPNLLGQQKFDTYYFALAIEPKSGTKEIKKAVAQLISSWNKEQAKMKSGQVIYLPIDFSDQYIGCLKLEKEIDLKLTFGFSRREGLSTDPIDPNEFFQSVKDFVPQNGESIIVSQFEFESCLVESIRKLEST